MTRASRTAETAKDKLFKDLQTVVEDAESLLAATASQAGDKVQEVRARAQASLAAARERLALIEKSALRQARAAVASGDEYVHENPWTAVGIAAGAGLLIGLLLARR